MTILSAQKNALRKEIKTELQKTPREIFVTAGLRVKDFIVDWINQTICRPNLKFGCFIALKDEIDTAPLNEYLQIAGHIRYFPFVTPAMTLDFLDDLDRTSNLCDLDILLMPGLAFGINGSRLGRGKGCYDRSLGPLTKKPLLVALALDCQVKKGIPTDRHDVFMDYLCTPGLGMHKTEK